MKLAIVTHAEHPELRGTLPRLWPEFMAHDPVVKTFWPRLYEVYPDFQLWLVDGRKETVGYACTLPVRWDGVPEPRGHRLGDEQRRGRRADDAVRDRRRRPARVPRHRAWAARSSGAWSGSRRRTASTR